MDGADGGEEGGDAVERGDGVEGVEEGGHGGEVLCAWETLYA